MHVFVNLAVQKPLYSHYKPFVATLQLIGSATTTHL